MELINDSVPLENINKDILNQNFDYNNQVKLKEPLIRNGTSYINGQIINDSDIFRYIGYNNYIMLYRKYPFYFKYFKECDTLSEGIGSIPGEINLFISDNPYDIKSDIIKTIHYKTYISPNSYLVKDFNFTTNKPTELDDTISIWIFICIIIISLLVFSVYVFIISPTSRKFLIVNSNDTQKLLYYNTNS